MARIEESNEYILLSKILKLTKWKIVIEVLFFLQNYKQELCDFNIDIIDGSNLPNFLCVNIFDNNSV